MLPMRLGIGRSFIRHEFSAVVVKLQAVGGAPPLRQTKFKINAAEPFEKVPSTMEDADYPFSTQTRRASEPCRIASAST